ncbi:MAG: hypothetical protein KUG78_13265 [Kangiellaceae bacterium]|nr:hypothetical protein [Kangiellaceae bacterium]
MMPDASLKATERQFMRLVGDCNQTFSFMCTSSLFQK